MRRNKHNATMMTEDGYVFHSTKEWQKYLVLKRRIKEGLVRDLEVHPRYELVPKHSINSKMIRPITYEADFRFYDVLEARTRVVDIKPAIKPFTTKKSRRFDNGRTDVYKIKKKLMSYVHGIEVEEEI